MKTIFLDTHVVIWLYEGNIEKFSPKVKKLVDTTERLLFSPIVKLELFFLYEVKKIKVHPLEILAVLQPLKILEHTPMNGGDLNGTILQCLDCAWTRDPFDRLIVGQSILEDIPLITKDRNIRKHYKNAIW